MLTAQQTLLQAELTEANDKFDMIQGVINLYHALGGEERNEYNNVQPLTAHIQENYILQKTFIYYARFAGS